MNKQSDWIDPFIKTYHAYSEAGGFQILFPDYRPDLAKMIASTLGLRFYDYRLEKMLEKGWEASSISLKEMTQTLINESKQGGLVAHNVEALLATRSQQERQAWLYNFFKTDWPNPVILPLAIYQSEAPCLQPRVCDLELEDIPEESFLMRLAM